MFDHDGFYGGIEHGRSENNAEHNLTVAGK